MGWTATLGNVLGGVLLAVAVVAVLYGIAMAAVSLAWGLTPARFGAIWFATGLAMTTGVIGYFVRKHVAGQILPVEYDVSVAFRGGQGGM